MSQDNDKEGSPAGAQAPSAEVLAAPDALEETAPPASEDDGDHNVAAIVVADPDERARELQQTALLLASDDIGGLTGPRLSTASAYMALLGTDNSRDSAESALRRIVRMLDRPADDWRELPWEHLSVTMSTVIVRRLRRDFAPETSRQTLSILKGVLYQAWRLGRLPREKYERLTAWPVLKAESVPTGRRLTGEEFEAIRVFCETLPSFYGAMAWGVFAVAFGGGLRRAELAKLRTGDVSDDARTLFVQGKGQKDALQPIPDWTGGALEAWLAQRGRVELETDALFVPVERKKIYDKPMNVWQVWWLIRTVGDGAKVRPFTPHDLRRTYTTNNIEKFGIAIARKLSRHKKVETTARYDRTEATELAALAGQIRYSKD